MKMWSRFVFVAVVMTLSVAPAYADNEDPGAYIGLRAGYNLPEVWLDSFAGLAEHTDVTAWHLAASGGYDFGFVRVGGTLWHYFLTIDDGIWRGDGEAALDQQYIDASSNGIIGVTADVSLDVPLGSGFTLHPGLGIGLGQLYGDLDRFEYETREGVSGNIPDDDLTQGQLQTQGSPDESGTFLVPLINLEAAVSYAVSDNIALQFAAGIQTLGPSFALGGVYHF